ncbi:MAG: hypothetical protein U0893_07165 [Chloroflexota bacterium]
MGRLARVGRRSARSLLVAVLVSLAGLPFPLAEVAAQRPLVDPRGVALQPADLPRGFVIDAQQTSYEPLRNGQTQSDADVVGVVFKIAMERPRTVENLQSGPVSVSQMIARSDDPTRATFSLDAQREYNQRENGYEPVPCSAPAGEVLCLVRRGGPVVEYRIDAVKNGDTLVSTTATGLPSALTLDRAISLAALSLARYDEQLTALASPQPGPTSTAPTTATQPPPSAPPTLAPPTPTPLPASTRQPAVAAAPPAPQQPPATPSGQPAPAAASAPKVKLPSKFDQRLAQPWSELMSNTATTASGEKMTAFLRRVVEETRIEVKIGRLGPGIGGALESEASTDGGTARIIRRAITINASVMNESPRVLATMLAHEITHANQPIVRSNGKMLDCVEAEVEAYAVQARVWRAFWGQAQRPTQTGWERTMNDVESIWADGGDDGLRHMVREDLDTDAHSCID